MDPVTASVAKSAATKIAGRAAGGALRPVKKRIAGRSPLDVLVERTRQLSGRAPQWWPAAVWFLRHANEAAPEDSAERLLSVVGMGRRSDGRDADQTTVKITSRHTENVAVLIEAVRFRRSKSPRASTASSHVALWGARAWKLEGSRLTLTPALSSGSRLAPYPWPGHR